MTSSSGICPKGEVKRFDVTLEGLRRLHQRVGEQQLKTDDWPLLGALVSKQIARAERMQERMVAKIAAAAAQEAQDCNAHALLKFRDIRDKYPAEYAQKAGASPPPSSRPRRTVGLPPRAQQALRVRTPARARAPQRAPSPADSGLQP